MMDYSFKDKVRDLTDVFSAVRRDEPRFISLFETGTAARDRKHEYLNDILPIRGFDARVRSTTKDTLCVEAPCAHGIEAGTTVVLRGSSALFEVVSAADGDCLWLRLIGLNGSDVDSTMIFNGSFDIIQSKTAVATAASTEWNTTQSFRKDIVLPAAEIDAGLHRSVDNQLNRQTAFALAELARALNRVALFGCRTEEAPGGLYYFAAETGAPSIDAYTGRLDGIIIDAAARKVVQSGGEPQIILCSPTQARIIINGEYHNRVQILRSDNRRGAYVAVILNELDSRGMTIMADPDVPYGDVWVLDPSCFKLVYKEGKRITDRDITPDGFGGIVRTAEGELTFEFKNVKQRCCRIKNLA